MTGLEQIRFDVTVVGAGPAGLAAAGGAREAGAEQILVLDRDTETGGILNQCIHHGFGRHTFGEELTGPEFAERSLALLDDDIHVLADSTVVGRSTDGLEVLSAERGALAIDTATVVLAMGARERTRGAIRIPGSRPAGVMTAGFAQKLVNQAGLLPGRRVTILGSGDIGLIMARRLVLEGVEVTGVHELMPHATGLSRNIVQCLHDFDIPLHLSSTVVQVHGRDRLSGVTVAPVDKQLRPQLEASRFVACDTLLVSIGLIPDHQLSRDLLARLDVATGGPIVTSTMETTTAGVFAGGNTLHIHDLVDHAVTEAALAGRSAAEAAHGHRPPADNVDLVPGLNVVSCVPHSISTDRDHTIYLRARSALGPSWICFGDVHRKRLRYVVPGETVTVKVSPTALEAFHGDRLRIDLVPREP